LSAAPCQEGVIHETDDQARADASDGLRARWRRIGELKAQGNKPPAYVFAEVEVTDPAGFQQYVAKLAPTLTPYHGKIVVRGKPDTKEAAAPNGVVGVLAFDNLEDAEGWYSSAAYREIIQLRQHSAKTDLLFIVEGLPQ
jgi:uncharacterized protein (DUF1330 family)